MDDPGAAGMRLDVYISERLKLFSRSQARARILSVAVNDAPARLGRRLKLGDVVTISYAEPQASDLTPEDIPLSVIFENDDAIVIDKPQGLVVHPGSGNPSGTLVNALLFHCGDSLSGIGGVARPGIVHRLDKDTSGVMVAAKTDAAHQGLSKLFAAHDIDRVYVALTRGAPSPMVGTITTRIGRSPGDRKRMAVLKTGGREAVTHYRVERSFGGEKPLGARVACTLETGRTHQIRVHLAHKGAPCLGDPVYGAALPAAPVREAMADSGLARQALHACVLGFIHPITGEKLRFETPLPDDMARLVRVVRTGS